MLTRRQPVGHRGRERLVVADAAAHLDLDVEGADDLGLQLAVVAAAERRVEVDQVDPLRAGLLPAQRGLDRVAEPLLGAGHALDELDGLAVGDVDGGQQLEVGGHGILGASAVSRGLRGRTAGCGAPGATSRLTIERRAPRAPSRRARPRPAMLSDDQRSRPVAPTCAAPALGEEPGRAARGRGRQPATSRACAGRRGAAGAPASAAAGGGRDRGLALALGAALGALLAHRGSQDSTQLRSSAAPGVAGLLGVELGRA